MGTNEFSQGQSERMVALFETHHLWVPPDDPSNALSLDLLVVYGSSASDASWSLVDSISRVIYYVPKAEMLPGYQIDQYNYPLRLVPGEYNLHMADESGIFGGSFELAVTHSDGSIEKISFQGFSGKGMTFNFQIIDCEGPTKAPSAAPMRAPTLSPTNLCVPLGDFCGMQGDCCGGVMCVHGYCANYDPLATKRAQKLSHSLGETIHIMFQSLDMEAFARY